MMDGDSNTGGKAVKILLMDDEEMVRDVAGRMFESLGYQHSVAVDGQDAIDQFSDAMRLGKPFDIVILDWNVRGGGMGGSGAAEKIRELAPDAVILVSSGDSHLTGGDDQAGRIFTGVVAKPYTMTELDEAIHRFSGRGSGEKTH